MVDKPFARKRSGGPKTEAGKAKVAGNALSHGLNSSLVVLASEDPAEFDAMVKGFVTDFNPTDSIETFMVHRLAHLIWKLRRLEGYEYQQISQAAVAVVKIEEIFKKMKLEPPSTSVCKLFEFLDEFTEKDLEKAEELYLDCQEFKESPKFFLDPVLGPEHFPYLWVEAMPLQCREDPSLIAALGLTGDDPDPEIMKSILDNVESSRRHSWATILLIKNREGIHLAHAALKAQKIMSACNLELSHRYHTSLELQIYRILKELRSQQDWRLERIATVLPASIGRVG